MMKIPFAMKWWIPEKQIKDLKNSIKSHLHSTCVFNICGIKYSLYLYPFGNNKDTKEQTWIFLELKLGNIKKIEADFTVKIESADFSQTFHQIFENTGIFGNFNCTTEKFFDKEKKFFVDGKFTVKINGILNFEGPTPTQQIWNGGKLGNKFWEKGDKDFTIAVDEKEIKVHKFILGTHSDVFATMFNSKMKESIENKVFITDFSFEVVETGIKLMYDCNFATSLSLDELMSLLRFFDKYNLPTQIKDDIEALLIKEIHFSTVIRIANCSALTNSLKLKEKCIKYLKSCMVSNISINDIHILDKDIALEMLQIYRYPLLLTI
uniref:BTB domain-containing protein n=1 Tax=Panagrolaimus sp. ES5 TaxID=591445 RepID=A0AC34FYM7_9BILA